MYVANFHDGTLSVIDTRTNRVTATIPVGESATGVAVAPDGSVLVVADTAAERVVLIAAVNELIVAVRSALNGATTDACGAADLDGDGTVTIDEVVRAVDRALAGCP